MFYCNNCLTNSLRPNADFEDGLCIACRYSLNEKQSPFNKSFYLNLLKSSLRRNYSKKTEHKCIVGISGGKDSLRQALWVRDKLETNPLLICVSYPPKQLSRTGANNLSNVIRHGFDVININPAPITSMELTRYCFKNFGNLCKATELALHAGVPKLAITMGIKNVLWGENPALQVGDKGVLGANPIDGSNHRNLNTLKEGGLDWINVTYHKRFWYEYPQEIEFLKKKINMFYLGPIWEDWSAMTNATYSAMNGLYTSEFDPLQTGDLSKASMLDEEYTNINMLIKYFKFGFGRATDYVNDEIRGGRLTRLEAAKIVEIYDGRCDDEIIDRFCDYIQITRDDFWKVIYKYTNRDIFEIIPGNIRPIKKFKVGVNTL